MDKELSDAAAFRQAEALHALTRRQHFSVGFF